MVLVAGDPKTDIELTVGDFATDLPIKDQLPQILSTQTCGSREHPATASYSRDYLGSSHVANVGHLELPTLTKGYLGIVL